MNHIKKFNESVNNMKTLAIYPGSFNPFHIGHLNIVEKAERVFGKGNVIVAIGINPEKSVDISSEEEKAKLISSKIGRKVIVFDTFLHELIESKEKEGYNVVIIRGLRNGADLSYEDNQLKFILDFKKDTNMVFFLCDKGYEHISSSAIRNLEKFRKGSSNKYSV